MPDRRLLVPCLLLAAPVAMAQNATTSVRGLVQDATGASIPGATVQLTNAATGFDQTHSANGSGEYTFQQLAPGDYKLIVTAPGFSTTTLTATLLVSQPATVNAKLNAGGGTETVDVSAETQTLNTTDATLGNAIDRETIMALPSEARNPQTLLALQPGVLFLGADSGSGESRNGTVSGARADQSNITLDGVDNNDQIFPSAFSGVLRTPLDSVEEFRVTTSNANADTGRSSGGQVNLVTRAGTNTLHGALYEYNRNSFGVANDWFNKSAQLQSGEANRPGKLVRNTYGIRLGGPLKKDKIFLFGNYEGNRQNESASVVRTVPTASFKSGILKYPNDGGSLTQLSPGQFASMDPNCSGNGTCPGGAGANPNVLNLFKLYPNPNATLTGDGYNSASYVFNSPVPITQNVYVARLDLNPSDKHRLYIRGSFQNDKNAAVLYLPGQTPTSVGTDDSKGISANYTWTISASMINSLRYGFVRQSYASSGSGNGNYVSLRGLDLPESTTRSSKTLVPLHNVVDDFTLTKGRHAIQFGANYRRYTFENQTDSLSYNSAVANAFWMINSGFVGTGGTFDPEAFNLPNVDPNFDTQYDFAVAQLAGLVNEETDHYNYNLSADGSNGALQGVGAPVARSYRSNEVEYYIQDAFRPTPNLTITLGLRHSLQQTPYETSGQQVQPTIDLHQWFLNRAAGAAIGQSIQPDINFAASGQARGAKSLYPMNWGNVAPRVAFAYSPNPSDGVLHALLGGAGQSSIRAGFGMYYDHFGQGLVANYSRLGSFSLNSNLTNPSSILTADTSPRFTDLHTLPGLIPAAAATITYPQTPSADPSGTGFAITNGLDDHIKTPYSYAMNLSVQRQLHAFTIETDYVGRLGRHLLQSLDLAQPLDLVDPASGTDYYSAGTRMSQYVDQGVKTVPAIAYFENLFPDARTETLSATQNIYNKLWQYVRGNETAALEALDIGCYPGCGGKTGRFWPLQYSSLFATSSVGSSSYHAGQVVLRHPMKHDYQFDLSYTYSKSLDLGSDSESNPSGSGYSFGVIHDAFNPQKEYAVSDFDTTHLLTADWVLHSPTGKGERFGAGAGPVLNALIGGWNLSGIVRLSSGLPFSIYDGDGWSTNWEWESNMVQTAPIKFRKHLNSAGAPQIFDDPTSARAALRDPYPGEAGQRNRFRGDGFFDLDSGLHKDIHLGERTFLQLAWEVFNVTNTARFDVHSLDAGSADGTQLGVYSSLLGTGVGGASANRRMQFSGRIEF